ncbi:hypothetical protein ASPZODRAFT_63472 [Penicilliopsis zonata CBS 506.65]|uniref:Uncharacterized protein n=1 Tax=Penicilliopsis zonata CBS 506.65 TaxID=1073090 RepID=A0A1L9SJW9_9EURO|nr:hypothetical protein ASPZODRAFT_63472 [Penicilliopsis zonata CBS 506.65]OJJ47457.1 hypothetical protein ASPZODRAFT_63472 [Penicilliopsis zonata CBS 506.65]
MAVLTSKRLIILHALSLIGLAVALIRTPGLIIDSDMAFMLGEAMNIENTSKLTSLTLCAVLLTATALSDLLLVTKLPQLDEVLALSDALRARPRLTPREDGEPVNPFMAQLGILYSDIFTGIAAGRFFVFFAVIFYIYVNAGAAPVPGGTLYGSAMGLEQLQNRAVFTFGFLETMFWLWIFLKLREERQEATVSFVAE